MYTYDFPLELESVMGIVLIVVMICLLIALAISVITLIGQWKTLKKGGKPGWGALIPFYNTYLMCDMVGINPWWILIVLLSPALNVVPVIGSLASFAVSIYFTILLNVSLAKSFGKDTGFAIGLILLPPVFYLILGLGKSEYVGKNPMKDIVFDTINEKKENNSTNEINKNVKYCSACGNKTEVDTKYCPKCGKEM
ncbi:MAG: zinc ribbon domain-containing protein [Bacilli bacterium]|nr:zinc ribbon domain-containing protein [Bacilli bacterium]